MTGDRYSDSELPSVSAPVMGYNTSGHIGTCLRLLLEQGYSRAQVIVVDNGSVDGSLPYPLAARKKREPAR